MWEKRSRLVSQSDQLFYKGTKAMLPADRERLSKAFKDAVASTPYADQPFEGGTKPRREAVADLLKNEKFIENTDKAISFMHLSLNDIIKNVVAQIKAPPGTPPTPLKHKL